MPVRVSNTVHAKSTVSRQVPVRRKPMGGRPSRNRAAPLNKGANALTLAAQRANSQNVSSVQRRQACSTPYVDPCKKPTEKVSPPV